VGQNLFIRVGPRFKLSLTLTFAKIGGNLDFSGNTLASVDLSATHVRGDLVLGPPAPHWSEGARLALRNTEVGVLGDPNHAWSDNTWPEENNLDLDGFVYTSIVIFPGTDPNTTKKISVPRFIGWLEKQKRYYPQPYEQVANVFQKEGLKDEAADMLYEGKNRELRETTSWHRLFLFCHKYFIGYAYRPYYTVVWVIGFALLGMIVLRLSKQGPANGRPYGIAYSIDMLLPIIKLRDKHYEINLKSWARYYFYFHKIMGYILASFLIAGLSGLTAK